MEPEIGFQLQIEQQQETDPQLTASQLDLDPTNEAGTSESKPSPPPKAREESQDDMEIEPEHDAQVQPVVVPPRPPSPASNDLGLDDHGEMDVDDGPSELSAKNDSAPVAVQAFTKTESPLPTNGQLVSNGISRPNNVDQPATLPAPAETHTPPNDAASVDWDDSWLEKYIRIPVWAKVCECFEYAEAHLPMHF